MSEAAIAATPLVIRSDDGLLLFRSVEVARGYLEVPDVEAGVYGPAFDAEGRLLSVAPPEERLEARPRRRLGRIRWRVMRQFNPVEVRLLEREPSHQSELRDLLLSALGELSPSPANKTEIHTLDELLGLAVERFGVI